MKVSARGGFRFGIFLTFGAFLATSANAQMGAYPMGGSSPPPPPPSQPYSAPAAPRPSYPGMAPGMMSQGPGQPKDLSGRFGLGVTNLGPRVTPQLSLDWQTSRSTSVEVNLGFDSLKDNNLMQVSGRFSRNMFLEEYLHFFLYLGGGFSSGQVAGKSQSGLLLEAGSGVRAFFTGMPNLGWHLRFGLFYKSAGDARLYTTGVTGAHYYF